MDPNFSEVFNHIDLSAEYSGDPTLREKFVKAFDDKKPRNHSNEHSKTFLKPGELRYEILKTLPKDVEPYRVDYFQIPLRNGGNFPFFIVKGFIPPGVLQEFVSWRSDFEKLHGITVFPQLRDVPKTLKDELCEVAGSSRLITKENIDRLSRMIDQEHPIVEPTIRKLKYEERRDLNWFSIDGPDVQNREDILSVIREKNGIRLYVGFIDQSIYIPPDSQIEKIGRKQINALPSKRHAPTVVGQCLKGEVVNFVEGKDRFAWVVEVFLGDTGSVLESEPYRALVKNNKAYTNGEFFRDSDRRTKTLLLQAINRLPKEKKGVLAKKMTHGSTSEEIVSNAMVYAKSKIARFLSEKGIPTLFRNHESPQRKNIIKLVQAYKDRGIPAEFDDFTDALRLAALCRCLTTKDSIPLLSSTLSLIYFPSTISFDPTGHEGVGASKYCEIKPHKNYAGMYNGYALGAACYGEPLPSFAKSKEKREAFETRVNLAIQTKDLENFRFTRIKILLELFKKTESQRGTVLNDRKVEFTSGKYSKLKNLGFKLKLSDSEKIPAGDTCRLKVLGFDPQNNEIIFVKDHLEDQRDNKRLYLKKSKRSFTKRSRVWR